MDKAPNTSSVSPIQYTPFQWVILAICWIVSILTLILATTIQFCANDDPQTQPTTTSMNSAAPSSATSAQDAGSSTKSANEHSMNNEPSTPPEATDNSDTTHLASSAQDAGSHVVADLLPAATRTALTNLLSIFQNQCPSPPLLTTTTLQFRWRTFWNHRLTTLASLQLQIP